MPAYSLHLHDGGNVPPKSTHIDAVDDAAAKVVGLDWLASQPRYSHVSIAEGLRLVGKFQRSTAPSPAV